MSVTKPQTLSLIDTVGAGYTALHRRLWVLLIPVALNAYLWLGKPLSLEPLLRRARVGLVRVTGIFTGDPRIQEQIIELLQRADARIALAWLNFMPLASVATLDNRAGASSAWAIYNWDELFLLLAVINLAALAFSGLFLNILGGAVRSECLAPSGITRSTLLAAVRIAGYALVITAGIALVGAPFLALSALLISWLPGSALVIVSVWYGLFFWAYIYTGFAVENIILHRVNPLAAIVNSVNVVRRNLLSALGLLAINAIVVAGFGVVWQRLPSEPWGVWLAIIGSAYIGGGLAAARLDFFNRRLAH